jgi:Domain of unknown function (DU1801)
MKGQSKTARTPAEYLKELKEPRRSDVAKLHSLIRKNAPKLKPRIQAGMLAYGSLRLRYASGRELDWFKIGVASNAGYISLYAGCDDGAVSERYREQLPKAKIGKCCVRFKRLADLDLRVLAQLIRDAEKVKVGT